MRKSNPPQAPAPALLFDADAPTLPNDYQPGVAQVKSGKYRKANGESLHTTIANKQIYPTITKHLPHYYNFTQFCKSFSLFNLGKDFEPTPAHLFNNYRSNNFYYEYRLLDLLKATREPAENLLAKIRQSNGYLGIEQANQWYNANQEIDKLYKLYSSTDDDPNHPNKLIADSLVKVVFGCSKFWEDFHKRFVKQSVALYGNVFDQIETITRYLELLETLPQYEQLPEAQRDEQLRDIFSDYLNLK